MKNRRLAAVSIEIAVWIAIFFTGRPAGAQPVQEAPERLRVPASETLAFSAQARGFQVYRCSTDKEDPRSSEWTFVGPEAALFDDAGEPAGKHYAGPTWEAKDGSKVVGEVKAKENAPDPNAIPWLLLGAKASEGKGIFSGVKSIQRLNTAGGKAPAAGCDSSRLGEEIKVPYKAVYYFYTAKP